MVSIAEVNDGIITRTFSREGNILSHVFVLGDSSYSMSYSPTTGEWEFNRSAPIDSAFMHPEISDAIAQYDF